MSWSAMTRATMASTMGTARGTTQGSWRPRAISSTSLPSRLTVTCLREMVLVGLKATRATITSPLDSPPWIPPDLPLRKIPSDSPPPPGSPLPRIPPICPRP